MKKYLLLVFSVALFASLPLFGARFVPTHDGEYHIIRFWQFYKMLSSGYMFPRWAPDLNSGYGLPLFIFHYPFPNYVGAFWHLFGVSFVDSVKLTLAFGYISACIWCFLWLRKIFGNVASLVGTLISSMVPYWFVDIYVRGSVGEVWALSFVLCTLFSLEYQLFGLTAVGVAGIVLSHNITALIYLPLIVLYMIYRKRGSIYAIVTGIGLSAYFWLPALAEKHFMVGLNSVSYKDYFPDIFQLVIPSWGTGFSGGGITGDEMSYQIGVVPILVLGLSFLTIIRKKYARFEIGPVLIVTLIAIFAMTAFSEPVWRILPLIQNIQYPWRLLMIPTISVAYLAAALTKHMSVRIMYGLMILSCIVSFSYTKPVTYERRGDDHYLSRPNFTDGTSSLGNSFSTIYTSWKKDRFVDKFQANTNDVLIHIEKEMPLTYILGVDASRESSLSAQILYFPGWIARIDGVEVPISYLDDGIIHIALPEGKHTVGIEFKETPIRAVGDWISLLSLFSLLLLGILKVLYAYRNKHESTLKWSYRTWGRGVYRKPHTGLKKAKRH